MIADHHATGENELSVKAGDIVRVIKKDEETGTNSQEPCGAHKLLPRDSVYGTACIMLCAAIYTTLHHFPSISLDEYQSITGHNVQIIVCTKLASHYITFQVFHWMNTRV